jgi:hypothetical protein
MKTTATKPRVPSSPKPAPKTYASVDEALQAKHEAAKAFFEKHGLPK